MIYQYYLLGKFFIQDCQQASSFTRSKRECQKKWFITATYEPNRLASNHIADTYEKLFPKNKYKISENKSKEMDIDIPVMFDELQQGNAK